MAKPFGGGLLHRGSGEHGIALTHGASSSCESPLLHALADALAQSGITVMRYNLPFRIARPSGPPRPADAASDRDGIRAAVRSLRDAIPGRVLAGGHSYGGRQTSIAASEQSDLTDGLVFLSYPLHPPGRASELRTAHFPRIVAPCLFVHGTRDPFGSPDEMREALKLIAGQTELHLVERSGHDLSRPKGAAASITAKIAEWLTSVCRSGS